MVDGNSIPNQQPTTLSEITRIKAMIDEIMTSLKSQRELLKMRGINLPPMTLQSISSIANDLTKLERDIVSEQTELGQLRSLADNAAMINTTFDLDNILSQAMDVIISLTGAERGYIILIDPETQALDFRVIQENELLKGRTAPGSEPQISKSIVRDVLESGNPLLADDAYKDERFEGQVSIANFNLRSVVCVPLRYRGNVLGVVYVDNRLKSGIFGERERNLLAAFANQVAVAMDNARLYQNIQRSVEEITAVKELTDNVFESIGSGVITTDAKDLIITFNRAAQNILNRHETDTVIGKNLRSILVGLGEQLTVALEQARSLNEAQLIESELNLDAEERIYVSMKFSPVRGTNGVATVIDNLTDQQERSEMLNIMKRYLPPEMVDNIHTISGLDLGGEKREVTCVFVDVWPLVHVPDNIRPQELMEMVNIYLAEATDCINNQKGIIDKYMGNEIMALFNTQLNPQENHAEIAIETALLIRDRMVKIYEKQGISPDPHYYRVGINTGIATLGNVGSLNRRDFTAIGDTINLSKRLEENATDGQIIISEVTRQHLEAHLDGKSLPYRFDEREPIQVKGRQQKTRIFEVFRL